MWQYAVVTSVTAANYNEVCQQYGNDGYSLEQANHYRLPPTSPDARWDLVFRKPGGPNLAEKRMEDAHRMLRIVRDALTQASVMPMLRKEIDDFLFKGSADDM